MGRQKIAKVICSQRLIMWLWLPLFVLCYRKINKGCRLLCAFAFLYIKCTHVDTFIHRTKCERDNLTHSRFEFRFGAEVMDTVASWTRNLCLNMFQRPNVVEDSNCKSENRDSVKDLSSWSVLDIGTGNGLLLHEFAKQG